jgi:hypothetical protein
MVTDVGLDTADVATANVAVVFPAATITDAGTVAADVLLLDKEIITPPLGAALFSVTIPWALFPPIRFVGFRLTAPRSRVTVNDAPLLASPLGFLTVTEAIPGAATSAALMIACNWEPETNDVERFDPPHRTVAPLTKFVPFTCSAKSGLVSIIDAGLIDVI